MSLDKWNVKLKPTGLNEKRQMNERNAMNELLGRQEELGAQKKSNTYKQNIFNTRQESLAADAMTGQQDRVYGIQQRRIYGMDDDDDAYPEEGRQAMTERPDYLKGGRKRRTRRRKRKLSRRKKRQTRK
jgi:hypothetical protein